MDGCTKQMAKLLFLGHLTCHLIFEMCKNTGAKHLIYELDRIVLFLTEAEAVWKILHFEIYAFVPSRGTLRVSWNEYASISKKYAYCILQIFMQNG